MSQKKKKYNTDTCWYDKKTTPKQMILGAQGVLFPILEHSDHFSILKTLVSHIPKMSSIVELGCGAAEFSRVFPEYFYIGADLPHIVNAVSRAVNPSNTYITFDIYKDNIDFVEEYDVVLMNAFIDVLEKPLECFEKVLMMSRKIILHRQLFSEYKSTSIKLNPSYGGTTYQSIINFIEFENMLDIYHFKIEQHIKHNENMDFGDWKGSMLLCK